ncbi:MAG: UDP-N-acetylmuramate dehydrogenase [Gammaproteobacteria bacterium]|nr:UDP-N-acetylmuramate dehydrogenase [Gammaproteobacteria bacterium]
MHTNNLALMHDADLKQLTTLQTNAVANSCFQFNSKNQLLELADIISEMKKFTILGHGSNVLFANDYDGLVVVNKLTGIETIEDTKTHYTVKVASGESWHDFVITMTQRGAHGIENLALIPGTAGAAPVQNIGAYGVEVSDFIISVSVFDITTKEYKEIPVSECGFSYRNSNFKQPDWKNKYIITAVTLKLAKEFNPVLSYKGLSFPDQPKTGMDLLNRVVDIRRSKLPDPTLLANAGSFFKNPIVAREQLNCLQKKFEDIPFFDIDNNHVKIPAAWLIEMVGFKGLRRTNDSGVYEKHALILVNHGNAHGRDIYKLACDIIDAVSEKFAISITPEVNILQK